MGEGGGGIRVLGLKVDAPSTCRRQPQKWFKLAAFFRPKLSFLPSRAEYEHMLNVSLALIPMQTHGLSED